MVAAVFLWHLHRRVPDPVLPADLLDIVHFRRVHEQPLPLFSDDTLHLRVGADARLRFQRLY